MTQGSPPAFLERLHRAARAGRDRLHHAGVARWEVYAKASFAREIAVASGVDPQVIQVEETGVAVRTAHGREAGFAAASGLDDDASHRAVDGAVAWRRPHPVDPLPPERVVGVTPTVAGGRLPPQGWAPHAVESLASAVTTTSDAHLKLRRCIVQEGAYAWVLATSDGFATSFSNVALSMMVEVVPADGHGGVWREWIHVPDADLFDPTTAAARLTGRAMLTRGRTVTGAGLHHLILHPEVAAHLLGEVARLFIAAPPERDALAPLLDRDGRLASGGLSLVDSRVDADVPAAAPCDGEGLPAARILILDDGVPRHRLASWRDAQLWGDAPRGAAVRRSYRDYPQSGVSNLRAVAEDAVTPAELLGTGSSVLYLIRPVAPVRIDPASGTFRLAGCAVWLEGDRLLGWQPVAEVRGRLGEALRRIDAVGTDGCWSQTGVGFVHAPSLRIRRQPVLR